ncbi:MAG: Imm27 family immunity protein [Panacagrimonas sp.]
MIKLESTEYDLVGDWILVGGRLQADELAQRIEWLISAVLEKVADSPQWGAWESLFRDPGDGRLWERTYPRGEMHGGGPPRLTCITSEQAQTKYGALGGSIPPGLRAPD